MPSVCFCAERVFRLVVAAATLYTPYKGSTADGLQCTHWFEGGRALYAATEVVEWNFSVSIDFPVRVFR